jgi:hypothetical protein
MSSNPNIQYYINTQVQYAEPLNDVVIKVGCNDLTDKGIVLDYDLVGIPKRFKINPGGMNWTDGINTFNTNLDKLCALEIALPALQIPPDSTTMKLNDTLLLNNGSADTLTLNPTNITFATTSATATNISNNNSQALIITGDGALYLTSNQTNLALTASSGDITADVNGVGNILLNAPNINSFSYAMPICFDVRDSGSISYGGGQPLTQVYQTNVNFPPEFFTETPTSGYTSTTWRIDFTLHTWNAGGQNNSSDKARAHYIDFQDQNGNFYTPYIFDATTPFCYRNIDSTWTAGGSNGEFIPFSWTDYVDFNGLVSTGAGNLPLKLNLYMGSDNLKVFTFKLVCSFTRMTRLP